MERTNLGIRSHQALASLRNEETLLASLLAYDLLLPVGEAPVPRNTEFSVGWEGSRGKLRVRLDAYTRTLDHLRLPHPEVNPGAGTVLADPSFREPATGTARGEFTEGETVETTRSFRELADTFRAFHYGNPITRDLQLHGIGHNYVRLVLVQAHGRRTSCCPHGPAQLRHRGRRRVRVLRRYFAPYAFVAHLRGRTAVLARGQKSPAFDRRRIRVGASLTQPHCKLCFT